MVMILMKLGAAETLESAQLVCTSWRKICNDPLTWRCIDMHNCKDSFYTPQTLYNLTRIAVDRSCGRLMDISLDGFGDDELLWYIVNRSPNLTHLRLAQCYNVSTDALVEVVSKLPMLTDIDLTLCAFSESVIHVLGRCCPQLLSFKFNSLPRTCFFLNVGEHNYFDDKAFAVASNMPGLHHLMILGDTLSNNGLQAILDRCSHLVPLDLQCCFNINLDGDLGKRCSEQIKDIRGPCDSTFDYPYETEAENGLDIDDYFNYFIDDFDINQELDDYDIDLLHDMGYESDSGDSGMGWLYEQIQMEL